MTDANLRRRRAEGKRLRERWHDLSTVCWCRDGYLCSACRQQDAIRERVDVNPRTGEWLLKEGL